MLPATFDTLMVPANNGIPNNPHLPALILKAAIDAPSSVTVRALCKANRRGGTWEWTVFDYHHFHPSSHEALICVSGRAVLQLGGDDGQAVEVEKGDALILPAGFGHKLLSSSEGFAVIGAYPPGQENPEILPAGMLDMETALSSIVETPLPETDPLTGNTGVLLDTWTAAMS